MTTDAPLAARLAHQAGDLLLSLRHDSGLSGRELGARGDAESNALLLRGLHEARPDDAVLSEESADSAERLHADRVWIIDPLDGTREYGDPDRSDWAVHVGLWERGAGITAAAVCQPALGYTATSDDVAPVPSGPRARPRMLVSNSRPPEFAHQLAEHLGADVDSCGSAGAKTLAVVRGEADIYVHAGGQWEWDSAAPVGVARAAGLHTCRIDGSPLTYNEANPYLPDLLVCRAEHATPILDHLAKLLDEPSST